MCGYNPSFTCKSVCCQGNMERHPYSQLPHHPRLVHLSLSSHTLPMLLSDKRLDPSSPTVQRLSHRLSANVDRDTVYVGREGGVLQKIWVLQTPLNL